MRLTYKSAAITTTKTATLFVLLYSLSFVLCEQQQQLNYDAVVIPTVYESFFSSSSSYDKTTTTSSSSLIDNFSKDVGQLLFDSWLNVTKSNEYEIEDDDDSDDDDDEEEEEDEGVNSSPGGDDINQYCYPGGCVVNYKENDMSFELYVRMSEDKYSITIDGIMSSSISHNMYIIPRESLVQFVEKMDKKLSLTMDDNGSSSQWSVRQRDKSPSPTAAAPPLSSIESIILSPYSQKHRLSSLVTKRISDVPTPHHVELWQSSSNSKYLFFNGTLRLSSLPSSSIHAEGFIHPALLSHPDASKACLISANPLPLINNLLKYRSMEWFTVVGTDYFALGLVGEAFPDYEDCPGGDSVCSWSEFGEWIDSAVEEWLDGMIEKLDKVEKEMNEGKEVEDELTFDVVFVDVPVGSSAQERQWLSLPFQKKIKRLLRSDSILVINHGHAPSLDDESDNQGETTLYYPERDDFLKQSTRKEERGGLGYKSTFVYDEPMAKPFDSTYIISFVDYDDPYVRFFRRRTESIDYDVAHRLHPSSKVYYYDGPVHVAYTKPSKSWERYHCLNNPSSPECTTFLPAIHNPSKHATKFTVVRHPVKGRSLIAAQNISKGDWIYPPDIVNHLFVDGFDWEALERFTQHLPKEHMYVQFRDFVVAFGFQNENLGTTGWAVSLASVYAYMNHACDDPTETVRNLEEIYVNEDDGTSLGYSPVLSRRPDLANTLTVAKRDIREGEEIMVDYRCFRDNIKDHPEYERFLVEDLCGEGVGLIPVDV